MAPLRATVVALSPDCVVLVLDSGRLSWLIISGGFNFLLDKNAHFNLVDRTTKMVCAVEYIREWRPGRSVAEETIAERNENK